VLKFCYPLLFGSNQTEPPCLHVPIGQVSTFFTFAGVPASRWGAMEFAAVRYGVAMLLGSLTASSPPVRMDQVQHILFAYKECHTVW
jgi:hypothetical protein